MNSDNILNEICVVHQRNRTAVAEAQKQLVQAARLLNRQVLLLGGSPAWQIDVEGLEMADTTCEGERNALFFSSNEWRELHEEELPHHIDALCRCLSPRQKSTFAAISALTKVMQTRHPDCLRTEALREKWGHIDVVLMNLMDSDLVEEQRQIVVEALQILTFLQLPFKIDEAESLRGTPSDFTFTK